MTNNSPDLVLQVPSFNISIFSKLKIVTAEATGILFYDPFGSKSLI